jgi:hypothetical protein
MDMVDGMATTIWSKILLCNKWGVIRLIVNFCTYAKDSIVLETNKQE